MTLSGLYAVTGGGSGIGAGIARRLADEGCTVAVIDRDQGRANTVAEQVGGSAHVIDVTDPDAVARTYESLGPLQGAFNGAGRHGLTPLLSSTYEEWRAMFAVNCDSVWLCTQAAARNMVRHGIAGSIVNISSINATFAHRGWSAYNMSKAANTMLTKVAALELADAGIRVNAVAPGLVLTPMSQAVIDDPEVTRLWAERTPLAPLARAEEIADIVAFLFSAAARWITGQTLTADGGSSLRVEPKTSPDDLWSAEALKAAASGRWLNETPIQREPEDTA